MAVLYVTEYAEFPIVQGAQMQAPKNPMLAKQTVAIGAGSVASAAFNAKTRAIRVHTDAICSFVIDATPTATATDARMAAGQTEYHRVEGGHKIAVITNT